MLSVPDLAIVSALALILFGPDQLPKVARKVGHVMRDVQNTSQAFLREIERAADEHEPEDASSASEAVQHDYSHDAYRYDAPASTNGEGTPSSTHAPYAGESEPHLVRETPTERRTDANGENPAYGAD